MEIIKGIEKETENLLDTIDQLPSPEQLDESHYEFLCGPQPLPNFSGVYGLPADSMRTGASVLYVLKHSSDAMSGLRNSIYIGGDVDSLASICTGILGGRHGLKTLPNFMIKNVEGKEKLENLAMEFEKFLA